MEIRNSAEALNALLGVTSAGKARVEQARGETPAGQEPFVGDRATLSSAGTEISQSAAEADVRPEKVAGVRAAIASGSYNVPASAVASKVVDAMLRLDKASD